MLAQNMHQKGFNYYLISQKASASGERSSPDPLSCFILSKIKQLFHIKCLISMCSWMWAIELGLEPCCHLFQMFASNVHQNDWCQFWFFKSVLEKGLAPPRPFLFFLGLRLWLCPRPKLLLPTLKQLPQMGAFRYFGYKPCHLATNCMTS